MDLHELQQILNNYNSFTPATAGDVYNELINKVQGFAPQINQQRTMQAQATASAPTLLDEFNKSNGAVGGISATSRLASILSNIGQQQGSANALGDIINTQRGNLGNMVQDILGTYNGERDAASNKYTMASDLYSRTHPPGSGRAADNTNWDQFLGMLSTENPQNGTPTQQSGLPNGAIGSIAGGGYIYPKVPVSMPVKTNSSTILKNPAALAPITGVRPVSTPPKNSIMSSIMAPVKLPNMNPFTYGGSSKIK